MADLYNFEVGQRYSFNTIAPITLGSYYNNVKVLAIVDFSIAVAFKDIITIHNKVKSETSQDLIDYTKVRYVIFETELGEKEVLALDWIDPNSISLVDTITLTVTIDNISTTDLSIIRNAITALGYNAKYDVESNSTSTG